MAVLGIINAGLGIASGILGSGGPSGSTLAKRRGAVSAAYALARSGNVEAWQYLGAFAGVAPLPQAGTLRGQLVADYGDEAAGYTAANWGPESNGIRATALGYYKELAPRFAVMGIPAAIELAPLSGPSLGNPTGLSVPVVKGWPSWLLYVLLALAVLALLYFRRK